MAIRQEKASVQGELLNEGLSSISWMTDALSKMNITDHYNGFSIYDPRDAEKSVSCHTYSDEGECNGAESDSETVELVSRGPPGTPTVCETEFEQHQNIYIQRFYQPDEDDVTQPPPVKFLRHSGPEKQEQTQWKISPFCDGMVKWTERRGDYSTASKVYQQQSVSVGGSSLGMQADDCHDMLQQCLKATQDSFPEAVSQNPNPPETDPSEFRDLYLSMLLSDEGLSSTTETSNTRTRAPSCNSDNRLHSSVLLLHNHVEFQQPSVCELSDNSSVRQLSSIGELCRFNEDKSNSAHEETSWLAKENSSSERVSLISEDHSSGIMSPEVAKSSKLPVQAMSSESLSSEKSTMPVDRLRKACRFVAGLSREELLHVDEEGDTILHMAIIKEEEELVEALIRRYDRDGLISRMVNAKNASHQTPLCMAVYSNQHETVAKLILRGADANVEAHTFSLNGTGHKHHRLLHYVVSKGQEWMQTLCELLTAKDIELDAFNSDGCAPIHVAIEVHGRRSSDKRSSMIDSKFIIQHLALRGANLNIQDGLSGKTPLHYAIEKKSFEFVSWFLDMIRSFHSVQCAFESLNYQVANRSEVRYPSLQDVLNSRTGSGNTSLNIASGQAIEQTEKEKILELLVRNGAQITGKKLDNSLKKVITKMPFIMDQLRST